MSKKPPIKTVLTLENISKSYEQGKTSLKVLNGISLGIKSGETVALVGASGSGKSTLLHIAGLLDNPDEGTITIDGEDATTLNDRARTRLRREAIGFIYQFHHLLPEFSALENVMLPILLGGTNKKHAKAEAETLLSRMGLAERLQHRPGALSGGEQQRVSIARALANRPAILLADEPTGNLDEDHSDDVFKLLLEQAKHYGTALLMVTHNMRLAAKCKRVLVLQNHQIKDEKK